MKKVCTIVVTYNRKEMLKGCVQALIDEGFKNNDILVVDNASTDGTREAVEEFLSNPRVKYVNTGENIGGAGGFNFGIKEIAGEGYDYVWLMDDDTMVEKGSLAALVKKAEELDDKFSFLSSLVFWKDTDKLCEMNTQELDKKWAENYEAFSKGLAPIELASFVGFFVNSKAIRKVGLPIKEFFIYGDDWEYSMRLRKVAPAFLVFDSAVRHMTKENKGASIVDCPVEKIDRCYYNFRNLSFAYRKHFGFLGMLRFQMCFLPYCARILRRGKDFKARRIWVLMKGIVAGWFFGAEVESWNK